MGCQQNCQQTVRGGLRRVSDCRLDLLGFFSASYPWIRRANQRVLPLEPFCLSLMSNDAPQRQAEKSPFFGGMSVKVSVKFLESGNSSAIFLNPSKRGPELRNGVSSGVATMNRHETAASPLQAREILLLRRHRKQKTNEPRNW